MNKTHKAKAKFMILFGRAFKESFKNIWRNKIIAIATITVITIIAFIFNILLSINTQAKAEITILREKIDMVLYIETDIEYHIAKNITDDIKKIEGVLAVVYTSKEESMKNLSGTYPKLESFFEKFDIENPLPGSIRVKTKTPETHKNIEKFIEESRYKDYFMETSLGNEDLFISDVVKNLENITKKTEQTLYFVLIAFIIGGTLIIQNAIKLTIFVRKKEIEIMKLIGVKRFFIRLPYSLEGIWYALIAIGINIGLCLIFKNQIVIENLQNTLLIELGAGILIGITSSLLASAKHLNA